VALCADENKMTTPTMTRKICAFFFTGLDRSRSICSWLWTQPLSLDHRDSIISSSPSDCCSSSTSGCSSSSTSGCSSCCSSSSTSSCSSCCSSSSHQMLVQWSWLVRDAESWSSECVFTAVCHIEKTIVISVLQVQPTHRWTSCTTTQRHTTFIHPVYRHTS